MDAVEGARLTFGNRLAALPVVVVALLIGNVLGFATLTGFDVLDRQRPEGALIVAGQACVGAYLAFLGCQRFLKDHRYASVWLVAYVVMIGLAILFEFASEFSEGRSLSAAEGWQTPYLVINAAVIEIVRRVFLKVGVG